MDSFIEWLVILFFIISFLNSILKPKKTQQKAKGPAPREKVLTSGPTVEIPDTIQDLQDIFTQMKREPLKKKPPPAQIRKKDENRYSEQRTFEDRRSELEIITKKNKKETTEKQILSSLKQETYAGRDNLTTSLLNPESARKAVLMAEILGKPKALRRRW